VNIYDITQDSVSFTFSQSYDYTDSYVVTGDSTGTVYGNAATVSFTDSAGSQAGGSLTFDSGTLYVNIQTTALADGAVVSPGVASVMSRTRVTPSPVPEENTQTAETYEETEETYTEDW
ncbi:MAG: hypothetical protein LUG62_08520, partial [Clostridiales bacterium]|nr:hypothetical protein [Clostridiales bacterium]